MADSVLFPLSGDRVMDANGDVVSGATLEFYLAGTSTPLTVYQDKDLATPHSASIATTSGGLVPEIWLGTSNYKVTIKDSGGAVISGYPRDNRKGALNTSTFGTEIAISEMPVITVTDASYTFLTANAGKLHNVNSSGSSITFNLGSAVTAGDGAIVAIRKSVAVNSVAITAPSSQALPRTLTGLGEIVVFVSDGATWHIKSHTRALFDTDLPFVKVTDRRSDPPIAPVSGERYLLTGTPTGAWASFAAHDIAEYHSSAGWVRYAPVTGWLAYVEDEALLSQYRGTEWVDLSNITAPDETPLKAALFEDIKAQNTGGGTPSAASKYLTSTLNTQTFNNITDLSLSSNRLTVPAGSYAISFGRSFYSTAASVARLFHIKTEGTATMPVASPGVVTRAAHGLDNGDEIIPSTTGTLPTGLTSGNSYFVINKTTDTFQVAATPGGTAINFTGSPSGTHSIVGGEALIITPNLYVNSVDGYHATASAVVTLAATTTIEMQHFVAAAATNGLGFPQNFTGQSERYAYVSIIDLASVQGPAGPTGADGDDGQPGGFRYTFSSSTTMADPSSGNIRLNNATLSAVTAIAIADASADSGSPDVSAYILTWDDGANSGVRGTVSIRLDGGNFALYSVTGASTDNTGWTQLAVTHLASAGSFTASDSLIVAEIGRKRGQTKYFDIEAHEFTPAITNGCSALASAEYGTELVIIPSIEFSGTADQRAGARKGMPEDWNGGTVTAAFFWIPPSGSGDVVWSLSARAYSDTNGFNGAFATAVTATDTKGISNALHISPVTSALTIANLSAGTTQMVQWRLTRPASTNAADTLTVGARLLRVRIYYTAV